MKIHWSLETVGNRWLLHALLGAMILLLIASVINLWIRSLLVSADVEGGIKSVASGIPPMPTEMDANFMRQVEWCLIPTAARYGYDLRVASAYRSAEEQDALYRQGRTEPGDIVTEAPGGWSLHNYGLAVDLVDRWRGYRINWERLGRIAAYCGIRQNDDGDEPHFENRGGLTTEDIFLGARPAPLKLPCAIMEERGLQNEPLSKSDLTACGVPSF